VQDETLAILPMDLGAVLTYSRTGEFPKEVRDALTKAAQLRQTVADTERQIGENDQQVQRITQEQTRIRENMKVAAQNNPRGEYYKRLETKLNDQETQLEKLRDQRDKLNAQKDEEQKQLEDYLNNLTVG
jgi:chromosome segregation ATPase